MNGKVVGKIESKSSAGKPLDFNLALLVDKSCWIAARRMGGGEYQSHTAPIYITVNGRKMRSEKADAQYFVNWINNLLKETGPGGKWEHYFPTTLEDIRKRYHQAKSYYENQLK